MRPGIHSYILIENADSGTKFNVQGSGHFGDRLGVAVGQIVKKGDSFFADERFADSAAWLEVAVNLLEDDGTALPDRFSDFPEDALRGGYVFITFHCLS